MIPSVSIDLIHRLISELKEIEVRKKKYIDYYQVTKSNKIKIKQLVVFTVPPSKTKMETFYYGKSRIWKMKEEKYRKSLPRIRSVQYFICEIDGKTFYPNLKSFLWRCHMLVSLSGAKIWPPETNRNICF